MDYVQGNEATNFPKPSPSPYLKAMAVMGIEPKETLIIEDNERGYTAAVKSGAYVKQLDYPDVNIENIMKAIGDMNAG
jgi:beta-phosphoglucomutase-like phosphatase (HAD superfamily)